MFEMEDEEEEYAKSMGSPGVTEGGDLKASTGKAPARAVLELGDMFDGF